jgi:hypothetical protein
VITSGEFDSGNLHVIQAGGLPANGADEMHVIVMMMTIPAVILAKGISRGIVGRGDGMHDTFFQKGLQGPVHRNAVKLIARARFDVAMGQSIMAAQEYLQDAPPHPRHTEPMPFQNGLYLVFHAWH